MNIYICPLCGENNNCQHGKESCWCTDVKIPKSLFDMIPEEKRGKVCICKTCIDKFQENQEANHV